MPSYEELKLELVNISEIIEKFPEAVKPKAYDLLVSQFLGRPFDEESLDTEEKEETVKKKKTTKKNTSTSVEGKKKRPSSAESYSIDRDLNLRGNGSIPSFKDFYDEKSPKAAKQVNTVAVYYLKKLKEMDTVTLDHVYTCYSEVRKKPPGAFRQSFLDAKNKEGWIEFDSEGNLGIPHRGVAFVEYDLPESPANN